MSKLCPSCQMENPAIANFCKHCGKPFSSQPKRGGAMCRIEQFEASVVKWGQIYVKWTTRNASSVMLNGQNVTGLDSRQISSDGLNKIVLTAINGEFTDKREILILRVPVRETTKDSTQPSGVIKNVTVRHVTSLTEGMGIHVVVDFEIRNMKGMKGLCCAYVYDGYGHPVKSKVQKYADEGGNLCGSNSFMASQERSVYNKFQVLIPERALERRKGAMNLKIQCILWIINDGAPVEFCRSDYIPFKY